MSNPIDHELSTRLDWLDYQLEVIGRLMPRTQEALAEHVARIRAERSEILKQQPVGEPEAV